MRISGFASGMDIDQIVSDMMKVKRVPLDKLKQKAQVLEWQRDDYRSINSLLLTFRNEVNNMKLTTQYRSRNVSSSDESKVTATASSAANKSSYTISKITQLANAEVRLNAGSIKGKEELKLDESLFQQTNSLKQSIEWEKGAVIHNSITLDKNQNIIKFDDADNIVLEKLPFMNIKVDGKAYKPVSTEEELNLNENSVIVNNDGTLKFSKSLPEGSNIKVDYIGKAVSETINIDSNPSSWKLSQVGIENLKEFNLIEIKDGQTSSKKFQVIGNEIFDGSDNRVGTLNKDTSVITFEKNIGDFAGDKTYKLEAIYDHQYTTFTMGAYTSSGKKESTFFVTGSDSLNSVINSVNSSNVGISLFFDSVTGKMTMSRTETGNFNKNEWDPEMEFSGKFIQEVLGFNANSKIKEIGKNAKFDINGLSTERNSNTFEMNGVTFTLKQAFDTPVTLGITNDNSKVFENITGFVKKYNELIEKIQSKLDEKRNKNYQPLTDEQKESLSDKQQEKWEEIAKTGLLRRDPLLNSILSGMRSDFYTSVNNSQISSVYNQLSKIGITTTANYLEGGKLEIDEAKLKKAIQDNPDSVEQLFRGENGILQKLSTTVTNGMNNIKMKAGNSNSTNATFSIGRDLNDIDKKQDSLEDRLKGLEDRYYRQFTAMEQVIQKANSQSSYLSGFFSN